jgi:Fe-S-cluster containining protein
MEEIPSDWKNKAKQQSSVNRKFLEKLSNSKGAEKKVFASHDKAFSCIDCMKCANCCKTLGPRFKTTDIVRISKHLRMKESVFIDTYLTVDEDADYVAKSLPCPFLEEDNSCSIYDVRPGDCKNYPYTDSDVFLKRLKTTILNSEYCPAVYFVIEDLKKG